MPSHLVFSLDREILMAFGFLRKLASKLMGKKKMAVKVAEESKKQPQPSPPNDSLLRPDSPVRGSDLCRVAQLAPGRSSAKEKTVRDRSTSRATRIDKNFFIIILLLKINFRLFVKRIDISVHRRSIAQLLSQYCHTKTGVEKTITLVFLLLI